MEILSTPISDITQESSISEVRHTLNYVNFDTPLSSVIKNQDWTKYSSVAVVDNHQSVFGIITEEDIVNAEKNNNNFNSIKAWEVCSHNLKKVSPETPVSEVVEIMAKYRINHIIIMDGDALEGIVTALDILIASVKHQ